MPAVRNKYWDGKIRLYNTMTGLTYAGLVQNISEFAASRNYQVEVDPELIHTYQITDDLVTSFLEYCKLKITPRDYQIEAFRHAVSKNRAVFLSPTASGKSLIIYLITRYYNEKTLIVVPTTSLVSQLATDFAEYGFDSGSKVHSIYAGQDKQTDKPITISTWQSIFKMHRTWFDQFKLVIGDEAHQFKAKSLTSIMEKLHNCPYRFGFTGTLDDSLTNKTTLEGLFGPVKQVTTTNKLMEQGHVAELKIKTLILQYSQEIRKQCKDYDYQTEIDFLVRYEARNKFITNLASSIKGNTLVLYQFVDKHGKIVYDMIYKKNTDRKIFFIHGGVDAEEREQVRSIVEKENDAIIVASYGTFSTGINIRNLHNVILASPSKSRIRVLQSIGRGLRTSDSKDAVTVYDIADDLKYKTHTNFTLQHLLERLEIYNSENFNYKIYNMEI